MALFEFNGFVNVGDNPELCRDLQQSLLARGYTWAGVSKVRNTHAKSLFFRTDNRLLYLDKEIKVGNDDGLMINYTETTPKRILDLPVKGEEPSFEYTDSSII